MSARDDGGPAFPIERLTAHGILAHDHTLDSRLEEPAYIAALERLTSGMSLRDHFAGLALPAVLSWEDSPDQTPETIAALAYGIAAAMLKARAQ